MKRIEIDVIDPKNEQAALLEYVAQREGLSIRQLASELDRDYRNVYDDVQKLVQLGLVEIPLGILHVPYDEIDIRKTLREAA